MTKKVEWIANDGTEYPEEFDLVRIADEKGRIQNGWWTGNEWDYGIRKIQGDVWAWEKVTEVRKPQASDPGRAINDSLQ
jgi:hypothetical protein